jgi:hypothetical protein
MKQNLVVRHVNDKNYVGFVFSEHLVPTVNETGGVDMKATIGVCWNNQRTPAVCYHSPEDLEWLEAQPIVIEELYADDEEEGEEEEESEEEEYDEEEVAPSLRSTQKEVRA